MKKYFYLFLCMLFTTGALVSCSEDDYTEEDALNDLQKIDVSINVMNASANYAGVEDATVKIVNGDEILEATTEASGLATFKDVNIGSELPVYIIKEGFTAIVTTMDMVPVSMREAVVAKNIEVYSLADENMATVKGRMTLQSDLTNRQFEVVPEGTEVHLSCLELPKGAVNKFVATTDANGYYEIKVPVASDRDFQYRVFCGDLNLSQKYVIRDENGIPVLAEGVKKFSANNHHASEIPTVGSALVSIEDNPFTGHGFELGVVPVPTQMSSASNVTIHNSGSGYSKEGVEYYDYFNETVELPLDKNGNRAAIIFTFGYGQLQNVYFNDSYSGETAYYTEKPAFTMPQMDNGSGAEISLSWAIPYSFEIKNNGQNYTDFPDLVYTYTNRYGSTGETSIDFYNCSIVDGGIFKDYGKTLATTNSLSEAPVVEDRTTRVRATASLHYDGIGRISYISLTNSGYGYKPGSNPEVTIISYFGYGEGAEAVASVHSHDRSVSNVRIVNSGTGYVSNINDESGRYVSFSELIEVSSGRIKENNIHLGAGVEIVE